MANRTCFLAFVALSTAALPARANPIVSEALEARQIPHTKHVQLTYANMAEVPKSVPLSRDGTALSSVWSPLASYTFNAGSGLTSYGAIQSCDCNVAAGSHSYVIRVENGATDQHDLSTALTVVEELDAPKDAGPVPPDAMPWEIPDPVEVQGLDCADACAHPSAAGSAGSKGKDGGCSVAVGRSVAVGHGASAGTLVLGLGLLFGVGRRRGWARLRLPSPSRYCRTRPSTMRASARTPMA
jgi:hypothetical protein